MPRHNLLKDALGTRLNNIPMTRNQPIEIPRPNHLHALREPASIPSRRAIPNHPLLRQGFPPRALQCAKQARQKPFIRVYRGFGILFRCGQVEEEICFYEGAVGFVIEDDFLVDVRVYVFILEVRVEFCGHFGRLFFFRREDYVYRHGVVFLLCAFFEEAFWSEDEGVGVFFVPGAEENVVLWVGPELASCCVIGVYLCVGVVGLEHVGSIVNLGTYLDIESGDVSQFTHFRHGFFDFWCQCDGGEDGYAAT